MKKLCREVWIEVDLDAIKKNVRAIRRHIPNTSKMHSIHLELKSFKTREGDR
jgi:alanine racemase